MKANQVFKYQDDAVSPVIGTILLVAITVTLASVVFILSNQIRGETRDPTPEITFTYSDTDGTARVTVSRTNLDWGNYESTGCDQTGDLAGQFGNDTVTAGDTFTGCSGNTFSLVYVPTNTEVANHDFP